MQASSRLGERVFHGIPASAGVCRGKVLLFGQRREKVLRCELVEEDVPKQIERLEQALIQTRRQILEVQRRVNEAMGAQEAGIFEAHLLVLEDQTILDEVTRRITQEKINAEFAFQEVADKYFATLSAIDDEYLRERAKDLRDVAGRILNNLVGQQGGSDLRNLTQPCIIVSDDLTPSTTAFLDRNMVLGFATDVGSKTSHTAILARSLHIPAVVGMQDVTRQLQTGQYILLDGFNGLLILNPTEQTLFEYGQVVRKQVSLAERLQEVKDLPAITLDGHQVILSANLERVEDTAEVKAGGAEGVGLYRTEFLFINRDSVPEEEEQYQAYRAIATALKPQPVVIRTLDIGGDKFMSHLQIPKEINPSLGWRAIRFCLHERAVFRRQVRAILRASVEGNVKMMFPLISGLEELRQANAFVEECAAELRAENVPMNPDLETGVMIEVPSAVLIAENLAKYVDFFSIGTNDLIQYTLAVDRLNEKIAHLYEPTHPAIVRLIKLTVDAAHRNSIWVGLCGEMAGDITLVPLLLGLGVDELSVAVPLVPQVKYLIRRLKISDARSLAQFAINCDSATEIQAKSEALVRSAAPRLFEEPV
ncbi:MAG: phosphoenolpyruvate--protein phosphotransferase [Candidatus Omnitrophica bacterium]|nr:phosphoenolpyruvate--protein phosphotransferase [Candidatus Omnitrophota bacterium]